MASYTIELVRPTVYVDEAGDPVSGFRVRILIYPWGEARDLELPTDDPRTIREAAIQAIKRRAAMDKMAEAEVEIEE